MSPPRKGIRIVSIIWSVLISVGVIALGASLLLPSTKRARFDFRQRQAQLDAATEPTTQPTTLP